MFASRQDAGLRLAEQLTAYTHDPNVLILALPRGGVPVAYEVAKALSAPLDVMIVRKLGVPYDEEFAMGAIASGGATILNEDLIRRLHISKPAVDEVIATEKKELARRETTYRDNLPFPTIHGKTIILIDDGVATGATMRAAMKAIKQQKPLRLIVAIPVAPQDTYENLIELADKVICLLIPEDFYAVGQWYDDFDQTTDNEVITLLKQAKQFVVS